MVAHTRTYPSHIPAHTPVHRFLCPFSGGALHIPCGFPAHTLGRLHIPPRTYLHIPTVLPHIPFPIFLRSPSHAGVGVSSFFARTTSSATSTAGPGISGVAGGVYVQCMCEGMCGYVRVRSHGGPFLGSHLGPCFFGRGQFFRSSGLLVFFSTARYGRFCHAPRKAPDSLWRPKKTLVASGFVSNSGYVRVCAENVQGMCGGMCGYVRVCAGMCEVCAGMCEYVQVCAGVVQKTADACPPKVNE